LEMIIFLMKRQKVIKKKIFLSSFWLFHELKFLTLIVNFAPSHPQLLLANF
jgi:hypothetical protein